MLIEINEVDLQEPSGNPRRHKKVLVNSEGIIEVGLFTRAAQDELERAFIYSRNSGPKPEFDSECLSVALCRSSRAAGHTFKRVLSDTVEELAARLNPKPGAPPPPMMNDKLEQAMNLMVASVMETVASKSFDTRLRLLEDLAGARADGDEQLAAEYSAMLRAFDAKHAAQVAPAKSADTRDCTTTCKFAKTPPEEMPCRACRDHSHFEARDPPAAKTCDGCLYMGDIEGMCGSCTPDRDHYYTAPVVATAPVTLAELQKLLPAGCVRTVEEVEQIHAQLVRDARGEARAAVVLTPAQEELQRRLPEGCSVRPTPAPTPAGHSAPPADEVKAIMEGLRRQISDPPPSAISPKTKP